MEFEAGLLSGEEASPTKQRRGRNALPDARHAAVEVSERRSAAIGRGHHYVLDAVLVRGRASGCLFFFVKEHLTPLILA